LREGIEGSLIITIICTLLAATGRRDLFRWVFAGVGAALLLAGAGGVALFALSRSAFINSVAQTWFETGVFLLAVVILTYMTFWMKRNSRSMRSVLRTQVSAAVAGHSALPLALLAFVTVGREALETVIFLLAIAFQSSVQSLLAGALLGLAVSLALSVAIYRVGLRLNYQRFFTIVGAALMVVAAGLLANAVRNLQDLHVLPGGSRALWDVNFVLSRSKHAGRYPARARRLRRGPHGTAGRRLGHLPDPRVGGVLLPAGTTIATAWYLRRLRHARRLRNGYIV